MSAARRTSRTYRVHKKLGEPCYVCGDADRARRLRGAHDLLLPASARPAAASSRTGGCRGSRYARAEGCGSYPAVCARLRPRARASRRAPRSAAVATTAPRSLSSSPRITGAASADHGRDDDLGLLGAKLDAVDAAVPRARREQALRAPARPARASIRTVAPSPRSGGALAEPARPPRRRARACPPRPSFGSYRPSSIARDEPELVEQLGQLLRAGQDHLDVAVGRLAELVERAAACARSPKTVASGVRRSWHASETNRAKLSSIATNPPANFAKEYPATMNDPSRPSRHTTSRPRCPRSGSACPARA